MIVNSHYVPLAQPFPIIYCNGEVGIQTGTLIVVESRDTSAPQTFGNREAPYSIRTHSHPVVSYVNKQIGIVDDVSLTNDYTEGIVWDRIEMSNVTVIAFVNNGQVELPKPDDIFLDRLNSIILKGRINSMFYGIPFALDKLVYRLKQFGVPIPMQTRICGSVRLVLGGSNTPEKKSVTSNNIMNLPAFYLATEWTNTEKTEQQLSRQIEEYITAFASNRKLSTNIEFWTKNEELQELSEILTTKYSSHK